MMPKCYAELLKVRATLEKHFKDVQDVEFTIQEGKLFMLQTRNGKRTAAAALKFSDGHGQGEADRLENRGHAQSRPISSTSCSRRFSTRRSARRRKRSRAVCPPVPAPLRARFISTPTAPPPRPRKAKRCLLVRNETSPGRSARHDRGRRHSHRERRCLFARRARRAPDGQGLRLRRDRRCRSITRAKTVTVGGQTFKRRRLPLHRRHRRRGLCRRRSTTAPSRDHHRHARSTSARRRRREDSRRSTSS